MLLAVAAEDGLAELLGVLDDDGRVRGGDALEGVAELLLVLLDLGLDGAAVLGSRILDLVVADVGAGQGEGRVAAAVLELDGAAEVACVQGVDGLLLDAGDGVDGGETLLVAGGGILEIQAGGDGTAHHLEVGNFAEVLLHVVLVDEQGRGAAFLDVRGRSYVLGELEQALHADVLLGADAEDRVGLAGGDAQVEALANLVLGEDALLEELLHQGVVEFGGLLDEGAAELLGHVRQAGGNLKVFAGAVGILEVVVFHLEDIHETVEAGADVDRELDIDALVAEGLLDGVLDVVPVGLLAVELVDGDYQRQLLAVSQAQEVLRADLDALLGVDHEHAALADPEGCIGAADEVVGTRGVDDIDLGVHELGVQRRRVDGALVELLEFVVVGDGVLVLDGTSAVNHLALKEHGFCKRGLTGFGGSKQGHVADVFGRIIFHF